MQVGQVLRKPIRVSVALRPGTAFGLVAAIGSLALAALVLELWKADFAAPWAYSHDALQNLMLVKATIQHGWYLHNPSLGYPFGQDMYDFPVVEGDTAHMVLIKLIAVFSSSPAVVENVFFLLTFPLTAAIAYWALRRLSITPPVACVCAVLYALAPYHFLRGEKHLFLQGYFAVPAGVWLALAVARGDVLFARRDRASRGFLRWASRTTLTTLAVCLLVATSEVYYAVFTLLLAGASTAFVLLRGRTRAAAAGAIAIAAIGAVLFVQHLPTFIYHAQHGRNQEVARLRSPYDSEVYGLRPVRLLLPVDGHRLHPLARMTQRYEDNSSNDQLDEGPSQAIGLVALVGLIWLIVRLLSRAAVPSVRRGTTTTDASSDVARVAGVSAVVAILIATSSGLSMFIAVYLTHSIRSWARMSIVLAFIGLLGAGLLLDRLMPRLAALRRGGVFVAATLVVVVALGTLDQTTRSIVPPYDALARVWQDDDAFVKAIEARVPPGSAIFQLPYVPIPEYGWDQARPYIHSSSLHWSWGAMAGRPADWQAPLVGKPPSVLMSAAAVTGFKGLYLDLSLYPQPRLPLRDFQRLLGVQPLLLDGRLAYLDLRPFAARLRASHSAAELDALRSSVLEPARIVFGADWGPMLASPDVPAAVRRSRWSHKRNASLRLDNPVDHPRQVTFTATLFATGDPAPTEVRWPDGAIDRIKVGGDGTSIAHSFTLPPGGAAIGFSTAATETNDPTSQHPAFLKLANYTLTDSVQQSFAKAPKS